MTKTKSNFAKAKDAFTFSQSLRRDFHAHPELGFQEFRTSGIVAEKLTEFGYEVKTGVGKTGVVAFSAGKPEAKTVLVRVDMDALPLTEQNEVEYKSVNEGVMHACGHDSHTAIGLTLAKILAEYRNDFDANVKLVFQPAEEGLGGAEAVIADGVLSSPVPDYTLGVHVWNEQPIGTVGLTGGPVMAGADTFEIKIKGKGGHGGHPHETIDPIPAAAQVVMSAQTIISRNVSPLEGAVISFCNFHGGTTHNIVPDEVDLGGTIRTYSPETRKFVIDRLEAILQSTCAAFNCEGSLKIIEVTPPVINNKEVVQKITPFIEKNMPDLKIIDDLKTMVSEDYALFLNQIPGAFIFIGSANAEKGLNFAHHHPRFNIDEQAMPIAVGVLLEALNALA